MPNSTDTAISAQETINSQKEKITCIVGNITQEGIDNLKEEITAILVGVKYDHSKEGRTNGHLTVIISVEEYHTIIGDNVCMYDPPVKNKHLQSHLSQCNNNSTRCQRSGVEEETH